MAGSFEPTPVLVKRGGGSVGTDTRLSETFPTVPPSSTFTHFKSIPTIAGSEGGFIGLIVGLGVLIIGSSIGIFFLLKYRRHGGRRTKTKSGQLGEEDPVGPNGFPKRRGTLFGWRSENPKRAGWQRAGGGEEDDEWDAGDVNDMQHLGYHPRSVPLEESNNGGKKYEPLGVYSGASASEVNLVAPPRTDPWPRSSSPEHDGSQHERRGDRAVKNASLDSGATVTSFPGGTKFSEGL